jgi:ABC-type Zn uptake system ZnuABC Zn-binding protein ZnuA/ABC-type Mn2+/Zn2+ transport system permease subunit
LIDPFTLPFVQRATLEVLLLSVAAGLIGPWIVLRALSFYSHAVGISTFPGLVLADGVGLSPQLLAFGTAGVFTVLTSILGRVRNAATDAITALGLVGFLAIGVILASDVFSSGANVDSLLFGSLLSIGTDDLVFAAGTALLAVAASVLFSRHWLARGFDEDTATEVGSGSRWFDLALLVTVTVVVIATLNAIGALLVIALLVVPAATVRLVTRKVSTLQAGTLVLVAVEGTAGIWLSVETNVPPGATIAVLSGAVFGLVAIGKALFSGRRSRRALGVVGAIAVGGGFLAGCGSGGDSEGGTGKTVSVIATTTQIADVVREVGGDEVEVTQLLQPNTDPHDYEPRPSDVAAFPDADVVFINGGHLDEWVEELIEDSGSEARVVDLGMGIPVKLEGGEDGHGHAGEEAKGEEHGHAEEKAKGEEHGHDHGGEKAKGEEHGHDHGGEKAKGEEHGHDHGGEKAKGEEHGHGEEEVDSHWWHDPTNIEAATARVAVVLGQLDPAGKSVFAENAVKYEEDLASLDGAIRACLGRIPEADRKLVTDHEAFGYFANRYGIEVIGTVIPALTTQAEPSAGDLAELEETIRSEGVKAVFPESSVPSTTAEAIARDTGASAEYSLYGDTLGPADSDAGTYIGMMEFNADQIAGGLSGGKVSCEFE